MERTRGSRALTLLFAALFFVQVGLSILGLLSIPAFYERVTTLTVDPVIIGGQPLITNEMLESEAAKRGLTLSQYALEQIVFAGAMILWFGLIAALIAWRAGWNWFAWYTATILLFIPGAAFQAIFIGAGLVPPIVIAVNAIFWPFILLYIFLFPNGRPVPRLALWVILPLFTFHLIVQATFALAEFLPAGLFASLNEQIPLTNLAITIEFLFIFGCQVYRYLRRSSPVEKQQTKWFLFAFGLTLALVSILDFLGEDFAFRTELDLLSLVFLPIGVGIAILRYRLWDIDLIIRRTITYAVVTGLLLAVFFGSVVLLQQAFAALTGSAQNELVTVVSTLAIAALFVPLRGRIQRWIDRRFNRNKYDAQQVLNEFSVTVRDETDLEKLTGELVNVVQETMQPKSVSMWLRLPTGDKR
jgi:hypothetical protein